VWKNEINKKNVLLDRLRDKLIEDKEQVAVFVRAKPQPKKNATPHFSKKSKSCKSKKPALL